MKTIYKYELEPKNINEIKMPKGSTILSAQIDQKTGKPCVWAFVDTSKEEVVRLLRVAGAGHDLTNDMNRLIDFIGTIQMNNGEMIWHVFECAQPIELKGVDNFKISDIEDLGE